MVEIFKKNLVSIKKIDYMSFLNEFGSQMACLESDVNFLLLDGLLR